MADYLFLQVDDVLEIHKNQIELYGGSSGLRDRGLLESAVSAPAATYFGELLHKDIFQIAAAYLFYLVKNHAFVDGNKRVGLASALIVLDLNGIQVDCDGDILAAMVVRVATDELDKNGAAEFLRSHAGVLEKPDEV